MISRLLFVLFIIITIKLKAATAEDKKDKEDKQEGKNKDKWKETDSPSKAPSFKPTKSKGPKPFRSKAPYSTESPTQTPSPPLGLETQFPSLLSTSISPVVEEPESVSSKPSATPIKILPTLVSLPKMEIMFRLAASSLNLADLELELVAFMKETLLSNQHILGNITLMELKAEVSPSSRRRKLEIKMKTIVEGSILFSNNSKPSTKEISDVLFSYFSNWGTMELQEYLTDDQTTVTDVEVIMEGTIIEGADTNIDGSQSLPASNSGSVDGAFIGLVVAIVIACIVCFLALAYLFRLNKIGSRKPEDVEITPLSSPSRSRGDNEVLSNELQPSVGEHDTPSLSGISLEDSLYTSNSHHTSSRSVSDYDPKRLDRVISRAKEFVQNHENEMEVNVPAEVKISNANNEEVNVPAEVKISNTNNEEVNVPTEVKISNTNNEEVNVPTEVKISNTNNEEVNVPTKVKISNTNNEEVNVPTEVKISNTNNEEGNSTSKRTDQDILVTKDERDIPDLETKIGLNIQHLQQDMQSTYSSLGNTTRSREGEFRIIGSKSIGSGIVNPPDMQNETPISITYDKQISHQEMESAPLIETQHVESLLDESPKEQSISKSLSLDDEKSPIDFNKNNSNNQHSVASVVPVQEEDDANSTKEPLHSEDEIQLQPNLDCVTQESSI